MRTARRLVVSRSLAGVALLGACVVSTRPQLLTPAAENRPLVSTVAAPATQAQDDPQPADTDGSPGPDDAGADRAVPDEGSLAQVADAQARWPDGRTRNEAEIQAAATLPIEDFRYDRLVLKGYAYDVCAGGIRPGASRTFTELQSRFGGSSGTMYSCRERWDSVNDFDCNGTVSNSSSSFYSTCWSNHARGQAIDLMVGQTSSGYNSARGRAVVDWLLAPDAAGNANAMARRLGIQQILFADRCWNSDGDRGISRWSHMRECGIGHFDHIHIDMTNAGAAGNVSYWGVTPPAAAPRHDSMFIWNDNGVWSTLRWARYRYARTNAATWGAEWDERLSLDADGDGEIDDILFWDRDTGTWTTTRWTAYRPSNLGTGNFLVGFDQLIAGDFDGNGRVNDTLLWNVDAGTWQVHSWSAGRATPRMSGTFTKGYDVIVPGDFDDNGRMNETMLWDRDTGYWSAQTWTGFRPANRRSGTWNRGYDEIFMGDWNNDGGHDDLFVWNRDNGAWMIQSWRNTEGDPDGADAEPAKDMVLENVITSRWTVGYDEFIAADLDGDGRSDDMFVWDKDTGYWVVRSWWRYRAFDVASGTWPNSSSSDIAIGSLG